MTPEVPAYYRHLVAPPPRQEAASPMDAPSASPPPWLFQANAFTLLLYEGWRDETVYTFAGPFAQGFRPVVTVNVDPKAGVADLRDYADWQVQHTLSALRGCRLLCEEPVRLGDDLPAFRAVFAWYPADDMRLYREQVYVLHDQVGYVLGASFTRAARRTQGQVVTDMMQRFRPTEKARPRALPATPSRSLSAPIPVVRVQFEEPGSAPVRQTFIAPFTIGRSAACDVRLDHPGVSFEQARVVFEQGAWQVYDAGSVDGLYVFGRRVAQVTLDRPTALWLGPGGPVLHLTVAPGNGTMPDGGAEAPSRRPYPVPNPKPSGGMPEAASPSYRADRFRITLPDAWKDETIFVLGGPVSDGFRHNITVQVDRACRLEEASDFVTHQIRELEAGLSACRVLRKDEIEMPDGGTACRVIFVWQPVAGRRLYQEQLFILCEAGGYLMTAGFTPGTRKTLGAEVERIMRSIDTA